jgi:hypothetical protein
VLFDTMPRKQRAGAPDYEAGRGLSVRQAHQVLAAAAHEDLHALYVLALYLGPSSHGDGT